MYEHVQALNKRELTGLIERESKAPSGELIKAASDTRTAHYGRRVFFRGLIEFSNHCKNGCYYCGLNAQNSAVRRYRMTPDAIVRCAHEGYARGFRSIVLQGGEDMYFNAGRMANVVARIKTELPGCALTLSIGELPTHMYRWLRDAGADRYLLRHESADAAHYGRLHPPGFTLEARKRCLYTLKELGFQVGAGFMVGSPGQTPDMLAEDLCFLRELQPEMVGVGPFLPHSQTRFAHEKPGTLHQTLAMLALTRLMLPQAMLPATTALGTLTPGGREMGLRAGANVVMPNLTPVEHRSDYLLYDGKTGIDSGLDEGLRAMVERVQAAGFQPDFSRGDHPNAIRHDAGKENRPCP